MAYCDPTDGKVTSLDQLYSAMSGEDTCKAAARSHLAYKYSKYFNDDDFWKLRERFRFLYNHYKPVPEIGFTFTADHYAHLSDDGKRIAFTPDDTYGRQDRQLVMKLGRYLARYHKELDNEDIKNLVSLFRYQTEAPIIHYARTAEEIIRVYEDGPSSCMGGDRNWSYDHPVSVYESPDIAVAYITGPNGSDHIKARSVVRMNGDTPIGYVRIYGDQSRMAQAFEEAGVPYDSYCLDGARIKKIPIPTDFPWLTEASFVMPYIDGGRNKFQDMEDNDEFFELCSSGIGEATSTSGVSSTKQIVECGCCGSYVAAEDTVTDYISDERICRTCYTSLDVVEVRIPGGRYAVTRYPHNSSIVEYDNTYYSRISLDQYGLIEDKDTGKVYSIDSAEISTCPVTGKPFFLDSGFVYEDRILNVIPPDLLGYYPSFVPGEINQTPEDSDDLNLWELMRDLLLNYGTPVLSGEIQAATHPDIDERLLNLIKKSINHYRSSLVETDNYAEAV